MTYAGLSAFKLVVRHSSSYMDIVEENKKGSGVALPHKGDSEVLSAAIFLAYILLLGPIHLVGYTLYYLL